MGLACAARAKSGDILTPVDHYSVPVAYGHRDVWIRGYVDEVVIGCSGEVIARHPRCYDREDMVFDPLHYLPRHRTAPREALTDRLGLAPQDIRLTFAALLLQIAVM